MAKKTNKDNSLNGIEKELQNLHTNANEIMDDLADDISGVDSESEKDLHRMDSEIDNIIYDELKNITSHTGDEISKFLVKLYNEYDFNNESNNGKGGGFKQIEDIFKADSSSVMNFFQERYKNKWYKYDDIKLITEQLFELREAINATRDAIITADDFSEIISRQITFQGMQEDAIDEGALEIVKNVEREYKLHQRIKNHIVPKGLQFGQYYAYTIPYKEIMEKYAARKNLADAKTKGNVNPGLYTDRSLIRMESVTEDFGREIANNYGLDTSGKSPVSKDITNYANSILGNIMVENDPVIVAYEASNDELSMLINRDHITNVSQETIKKEEKSRTKSSSAKFFADGTITNKDVNGDYDAVKGCYLKLMSPEHVIPVKIMNQQVIGYYYAHEDTEAITSGPQLHSGLNPNFTNPLNGSNNKQDLEKEIVGKITDKIVASFDKKFLENNTEFKELISNALLFDDLYKKNVKFQFISKEYMTEFVVNEDEYGNGKSIIDDSIFYAKLYLALLMFKMITIIGKSTDTRMYYVKSSTADKDISGKVQDVARSVRSRELSFTDLMNYNSMTSKVGAGKSIFVPVGKSGERAFDAEIISGQQVELHSELMEFLRSGMITATGVPSVFMQHTNEVDYSRTLVMMNSKFVSRIVNLQIDFNLSITELYKKILRFSTNMEEELISKLQYKFNPPKAQNNTTTVEQLSNSEATAQFMVDNEFGKETELNDKDRKVKDLVYKDLVRELQPSLPWDLMDKIRQKAEVEAEKETLNKTLLDNPGNDQSTEGSDF